MAEMRDLEEPLLHHECVLSVTPVLVSVFLRTTAFTAPILPTLAFRLYNLTLVAGGGAVSAAYTVGIVSALRYLTEFVGNEILMSWSQIAGSRSMLFLSSAAIAVESAVIGAVASPKLIGALHVIGGLAFSSGSLEYHRLMEGAPSKRAVEMHRQLLMILGMAFVVGPICGVFLSSEDGGTEPYIFGHIIALISMASFLFWVPDCPQDAAKQSQPSRRQRAQEPTKAPSRACVWYSCALALHGMGMAIFGSTCALWMKFGLGWQVVDIGLFIAFGNLLQVLMQVVVLPRFSKLMEGKDHTATQYCLLLTGIRFVALATQPDKKHAFAILFITSPGFCSNPLLSGLHTRNARKDGHVAWSATIAGMNVAASAMGALLGSHLLASAFANSLSLCCPVLVVSACHFLAGACVSYAQ